MRFFDKIVTLRKGEGATVWLMFAYSFLAMTSHNIVRPLTKSKSIAQFGAVNMPYLLLGASVAIAVVMIAHSAASRRLPGRAIIPATQAGLVAVLIAFWFLFRLNLWWVSIAFFVFGLLYGILMISQFWTLANDIYDARQARRIFGFIGGGSCLGGAVGGGLTAFTVQRIGTGNLVLVSAAVLVVCIGIVLLIERRQPPSADFAPVVEEKGVGGIQAIRLLRESRHLQLIALVIGFAAVGGSLIDQQLNMAAEQERQTEDAISALLGLVTVYLSLIAFVLQVGLTSRIHRSLGLTFALLLLPVGLGVAGVGILVTGALWAVAGARVLDTSLRYTVDKTTREVLFLPLPSELKLRAKPFVDVTVDRFAKGAGAVLALVLIQDWGAGLDWRRLSYAGLSIMVVWIMAAMVARRGYLQAFRRSLEARSLAPADVRVDVADAATIEALVQALSSPDETAVLYAIEMLDSLDKRALITPLLLHHESARVRARALAALAGTEPDRAAPWIPLVERLVKDTDADVRAAAVRALAALRHADRATLLRAYLDDPEPRVVATAAAELADSGRPADVEAAEAALARLVGDTRTAAAAGRRDAAAALRRIANPAFRTLLVQLIHDPEIEVARDAIASARAVGPTDAIFVPALVARLGHRQLKPVAREALVSYGEDAIDFLAHVLADHHEHIWVRRHVPATLARIGRQRSMDVLIAATTESDGFLRYKIIEAIESLHRAHPDLAFSAATIEGLVVKESTRYCHRFSLRADLLRHDPAAGSTLVARALDDKLSRGLDRLFRLVGILYPWKDVEATREALEHGDARTRVSALEYFDNLLGGVVRKKVMPLCDNAPLEDRVRHANHVAKTRPRDKDDTIAQLIHDEDPVLSASAIAYLRGRPLKAPIADDLEYVLEHRESDPYVRDAAAALLGSGRRAGGDRSGAPPATAAVLLADRLREIPIFAAVSVDELFRLAVAAREVHHEAGAEIVGRDAPPADVILLIEGTVSTAAPDGPAAEISAPDVVGLTDVLEGRPHRQTVVAVTPVRVLTLPAADLWTALADNVATAQGMFRMLLGSPEAQAWAAVHRPLDPSAAPAPGQAIAPLDVASRLRQTPIFSRATVEQLMDLVEITQEVRLSAGHVLLGAERPAAIYHLLGGEVRLDGDGASPAMLGAGSTIGVAETLTGAPAVRTATVARDGRALRLERNDVFEVLADHPDLLQGVFSGAIGAGRGTTEG
jgi:ATP/ADP translocase/CRP-like cAMP-binding protein/HEAT repeat protein